MMVAGPAGSPRMKRVVFCVLFWGCRVVFLGCWFCGLLEFGGVDRRESVRLGLRGCPGGGWDCGPGWFLVCVCSLRTQQCAKFLMPFDPVHRWSGSSFWGVGWVVCGVCFVLVTCSSSASSGGGCDAVDWLLLFGVGVVFVWFVALGLAGFCFFRGVGVGCPGLAVGFLRRV